MSDDLTDRERYPTLTPTGQQMLDRLREHPCAPIFRNRSGNRLLAEDVEFLRTFESEILATRVGWNPNTVPDWIADFVARTFDEVPYYRALGSPPRRLEDLPTVSRGDFAHDIARFVPDSVPVDRLINFRTTGTTGHPLLIASHPRVAGCYLAFHKRALRRFGVELTYGGDRVGVILLGYQRKCFTYVSVTPLMDESGLAKINLHPDDWRAAADRERYLDAMDPEVYAGDPISFAELLKLPLTTRPKALISVSMALSSGLRKQLEQRLGCPVLDVYSMNEVGPVGVFDATAGGHVLLQPRLFVEILDADGRSVRAGERGEITVTGGFNFCLPLLRYRTGDFGALSFGADGPVIVGLSGRSPLRFRNQAGLWHNNIDISHALGALPLSRFRLHQDSNAGLTLYLPAGEMNSAPDALAALTSLFGDQSIAVAAIAADDKFLQYTSDFEGALL